MITIYHNPRCSKSRATLAILEESGAEFNVHLYLEQPAPRSILERAWDTFGEAILRKGEADYKAYMAGKNLSKEEVIEALLAHPKILERPLVVNGEKIALGRPPERVKSLLESL